MNEETMSVQSHPPIPPNCKWFFELDGHPFLGPLWAHERRNWSHDSDWPISINKCEGIERHVVASIARCAWLDSAPNLFRYSGDNHEFLYDPKTQKPATKDQIELQENCEKNAELWRKWGGRNERAK